MDLRVKRTENFKRKLEDNVSSIRATSQDMILTLCLLLVSLHTGFSDGLKLVELRIDKHTVRGNKTTLECLFDLQGERLYSVKWYKDGHEFYRFLPRDNPPINLFPLPGIHVDEVISNETHVVLENLELSSSGRYRCEVSAEAPSFQTVSDHGDMMTVALPETGPRITGGQPRYHLGDSVSLDCISGPSKPPASLAWFINGSPVNLTLTRGPRTRKVTEDGLEETALGLRFRVERRHFRRGDLKLKCLASIATIYWNSNEESVEGDRLHRPPALEMKDNHHFYSRADQVSVSRGSSLYLFSINSLMVHLMVPLLHFCR